MRAARTAEVLDDAAAEVGEGPAWDTRSESLVWVDLTQGRVHLSDADGDRRTSYEIGSHVGAAMPADGEGWLLARREGFALLDVSGRITRVVDVLAGHPQLRFNDAKCDPNGRAFGGTMAYDIAPGAGALYRLDPGPRASMMLSGLTMANGMAWSPDQATMYIIDSTAQQIRACSYNIETGELGNTRVFVEIDGRLGTPDGMCRDDTGCLWVAVFGGGAVHRYTPRGELDMIVRVPASQVTSCCFGGPRRDRLYITSATHRLNAAQLAREPAAGALFAIDVEVTGPAATLWQHSR